MTRTRERSAPHAGDRVAADQAGRPRALAQRVRIQRQDVGGLRAPRQPSKWVTLRACRVLPYWPTRATAVQRLPYRRGPEPMRFAIDVAPSGPLADPMVIADLAAAAGLRTEAGTANGLDAFRAYQHPNDPQDRG